MKVRRQNEPMSSLTHLIGIFLAIAGLVLLVVSAAMKGNAWHVVSFSVFGTSMILLYLASTAYHFVCITKPVKKTLQKLDHAMIFILIAGTYTPIALVPLRGGWGWSLFGAAWAIAIVGVIIKVMEWRIKEWQSVALYLGMGWLVLIMMVPLIRSLPAMGLAWLFIGGACYTIGVVFFAIDRLVPRSRWFGMHEVFHMFVIAGSFSHFWMMFRYVLYIQ